MSVFGKILLKTIDVATFPVKVGESLLAKSMGTDRRDLKRNVPMPTNLTDWLKEALEDADED